MCLRKNSSTILNLTLIVWSEVQCYKLDPKPRTSNHEYELLILYEENDLKNLYVKEEQVFENSEIS